MRINEIECDDNIVLSKFKFNCDEIDKSIPAPLPRNLNHFMLIVGKPGSSMSDTSRDASTTAAERARPHGQRVGGSDLRLGSSTAVADDAGTLLATCAVPSKTPGRHRSISSSRRFGDRIGRMLRFFEYQESSIALGRLDDD